MTRNEYRLLLALAASLLLHLLPLLAQLAQSAAPAMRTPPLSATLRPPPAAPLPPPPPLTLPEQPKAAATPPQPPAPKAAPAAPEAHEGAHAGEVHWDYEGENGPPNWGKLKPEFNICAIGKRQSPINIEDSTSLQGPAEPVQFEYRPSNATVVNNGHTIQVDVQGENTITVRGM